MGANARYWPGRGPRKPPIDADDAAIYDIVQLPKQRRFCKEMVKNLTEGQDVDVAKVNAVKATYKEGHLRYHGGKKNGALAKADDLLSKPWTTEAMKILFGRAGKPPTRVFELQAELMDSENPAVKQRALDRYWAVTVPKQTVRIALEAAHLHAVVPTAGDGVISARKVDLDP